MPQPQVINTAQLNAYLNRINTGDLAEVVKVYQELQDKGYGYAGWAKGVATAQTVTGVAAIDYLTGTAWMGLGGDECKNLTTHQIDAIRVGMAEGYINALLTDANRPENDGIVRTDVDFRDTQAFHLEVLEQNGLTINNWTLQVPIELIRQTEGDAAADALWSRLRDTGGEGLDALLESQWLYTKIGKLAFSNDPIIASKALAWIEQVPGTANFDTIGHTWEAIKTALINQGLSYGLSVSNYFNELKEGAADFFRQEWLDQLNRVDHIYENPASPIVLDLDGDGVETLNIGNKPIYFDHNDDGFKERTGWAGADDGILVRDLNNNNQIDHGGELFGNNTIDAGQSAENGFEALRALDSNNDRQFTNADTAWNTVKVWKDSNSNAKLDAGELLTLEQAKVAAISLDYSIAWYDTESDLQNNQHRQQSTYTDSTGNVRESHDVWFATNKRDTVYGTEVEIGADIKTLFNLPGTGKLTDLHTAMALDTSGSLQAVVTDLQSKLQGEYSILNLFNDTHNLFLKWAGVDNISPVMERHRTDAREVLALEKLLNKPLAEILENGLDPYGNMVLPSGPISHAVKMAQGQFTAEILKQTVFQPIFGAIGIAFDPQTQTVKFDTTQATLKLKQLVLNKLLVDQITTLSFFKLAASFSGEETTSQLLGSIEFELASDPVLQKIWKFSNAVDFRFLGAEDDLIGPLNSSRVANQPALLSGLAGEDTLIGFESHDVIDGGTGNDHINGDLGNDLLIGSKGNDEIHTGYGTDTIVYSKGDGRDTITVFKDDTANIDTLKFTDISSSEVQLRRVENDLLVNFTFASNDFVLVKNHFESYNGIDQSLGTIEFADGLAWNATTIKSKVIASTTGNDILTGYTTADTLRGGNGNDTLYGRSGNDILYGDAGNDFLYGEAGADRLYGSNGNDLLNGGDGNDSVFGQAGNDTLEGDFGNDLLDGGLGDDLLYGGAGSDTYQYRKGDGRDTIIADQYEGNHVETLKLLNATASEVNFFKENSDLLIVINSHPHDPIRIKQHFNFHGTGHHVLDRIQFSDGTIWSSSIFNPKAISYAGVISTINGTSGNDVLEGSKGDDLFIGDAGNDTYIYRKGHGRDTIDTYVADGIYGTQTEILKFADISSTDVILSRNDNDLLIKIKSSANDEVRVLNHFDASNNNLTAIDSLVFSNNVTWNFSTIQSKVLAGTIGDDNITGYQTNNVLRGNDGDDTIFGEDGDDSIYGDNGNDYLFGDGASDKLFGGNGQDRLYGGEGNDHLKGESGNDELDGENGDDILEGNHGDDFLSGGAGNNTYIFSVGDGHDTINSNLYSYDNTPFTNTIKFNNILPTDVLVSRENDDLIVDFKFSSGDQIRVEQHFLSSDYGDKGIDQIMFSDGSIWTQSNIAALVLIGTESSDFLYGDSAANTLSGGGSNDVILGENGNDTINGGTGNDETQGGQGSDTFVYKSGDGKDTVHVSDGSGMNFVETLRLVDVKSSDIKLGRYYDDLYIQHLGSNTDHVKIANHFSGTGNTADSLDKIIFADAVTWGNTKINTTAVDLMENPDYA